MTSNSVHNIKSDDFFKGKQTIMTIIGMVIITYAATHYIRAKISYVVQPAFNVGHNLFCYSCYTWCVIASCTSTLVMYSQ